MRHSVYRPVRRSRFVRLRIRDAGYCIRTWGPTHARPIVLLHGIRDTSATFQFLVDALQAPWQVFAPDWRGHGRTTGARGQEWFHEYLGDLHLLLDRLFGSQPVDIVGHSLGGNVASVYAGLFSQSVRRLVVIDAFGTPRAGDVPSAEVLRAWVRNCGPAPAEADGCANVEELAQRLSAANPRLTLDKALFLAAQQSRRTVDGRLQWRFDSRVRRSVPTLRTEAEWIDCWRRSEVPMLWVKAAEPLPGSAAADADTFARLSAAIGSERLVRLPNTGHNIQHDDPRGLAALVERFLG